MSAKTALARALNAELTAKQRADALQESSTYRLNPEELDIVAAIVADPQEPASVRRSALNVLQVAQFANPNFPKWRKKFTSLMVKLLDDKDTEFRGLGLEYLAKQ